ncbi:MAG: hypothetical protein ACRC8K_08810 [Waterburya sp.]
MSAQFKIQHLSLLIQQRRLSESEIGDMVQAALGGLRASEFVDGKRELDVSVELQSTFVQTPEQLRQL